MNIILIVIQLSVTIIMGIYFYRQLRQQKKSEPVQRRESSREMERLIQQRAIHLSEPLAERVRPTQFSDIIGQEDGIQSLKAILCGENPQHVLIYGPPGIGKTCAARLVLEAAKASEGTPFRKEAPFIEMDATCVRFDERAIADAMLLKCHQMIRANKTTALQYQNRYGEHTQQIDNTLKLNRSPLLKESDATGFCGDYRRQRWLVWQA